MATFTYSPSNAAQRTYEPLVLIAKFGDGYEQRTRPGINNNPERWDLSFNNKTQAVADAIEIFFSDHGGVNSFGWTAQASPVERYYKCTRWTRSFTQKGVHSVAAYFEQVFGS